MTDNDVATLLSFAAAAIALAGFSSLVTSIDRRRVGVGHEVISLRIRSLISIAFSLVLLAFLPIILEGFVIEIDLLWAISCAAGIAFFLPMLAVQVTHQFQRSKLDQQGFSWSLYWTNVSLTFFGSGIAASGILDLIPARGAYFLVLLSGLAIVFAFFHRIVVMVDEGARVEPHSD